MLGLLAEGLTAAEIGDRLRISKETVMTHRRNLMRKLGLRNRTELIRYAIKPNIVGPD
ncbi:response regulator transcription factor [Lamprobacter sp.]|uniref:response regulator transcription factor n=1 Tax=Lamprobacter sp. TaxID=3100796 RepID=UPI003A4D7139